MQWTAKALLPYGLMNTFFQDFYDDLIVPVPFAAVSLLKMTVARFLIDICRALFVLAFVAVNLLDVSSGEIKTATVMTGIFEI